MIIVVKVPLAHPFLKGRQPHNQPVMSLLCTLMPTLLPRHLGNVKDVLRACPDKIHDLNPHLVSIHPMMKNHLPL
jgi:hypothetical protein